MRVKYFSVPVHDDDAGTEAVNQFLAQHKIIKFHQQLIDCGAESFWAISVQWLDGGRASVAKEGKAPSIDYREVLSEEEFRVFSKLRVRRKELAEQNGVAVYRVFSNAQLAAMVEQRVVTSSTFSAIAGVGEAKMRDYGEAMLAILIAGIPTLSVANAVVTAAAPE